MTAGPPSDDSGAAPLHTGTEYQPDPFAAPASMDELRRQAPLVSLLVVVAFVPMLVASAFLSAFWWRAMGGLFLLVPTLFFLWRFYQNPALLSDRLGDMPPQQVRRQILGLACTLVTLQLCQLYWGDIVRWIDRL